MGDNTLIKGVIVSCVYAIFRYIETHFITKEPIAIKKMVQDILVVYISFVGGTFVYEQMEPMKAMVRAPSVFTSEPDF